jgi:signal transduction histidine kinase
MDTLNILVIDDEPGMRAGVARALENFTVHLSDVASEVGFRVAQAGSGEEGLGRIEAAPPHILLLDYKLPGICGLEVLDRVAQAHGEILTIMITAYASLETAVTATKRGAYDFLAKPFTPDELKSVIRKAAARIVLAREARKLAREKRQVRFQFISMLAHELKAPLAAIQGYVEIVRNRQAGDDPAAYEHMLDRCLIRTQGMSKLIYDLLDLTRIESGQKTRNLAALDVREVASVAIEAVAPEAAERNITIDLQIGGPVPMVADREEIEIILNNLLSNAVKYNRPQGRIEVKARLEEDKVALSVADTGIGMTKEERERIFADFVRIKSSKTRDILGSGLGLSIVKKLVLLYDGKIDVESEPDAGSTFTVTLKASPPARPAETLME